MGHQPLSAIVAEVLGEGARGGDVSLNQLFERAEGRGPYAMMILLCLPFVTPVSLPGVSNVFGLALLALAWSAGCGRPGRLPGSLGNRSAKGPALQRVLRISLRVLRFIERWVKPRRTRWLSWGAARAFNAFVIGLSAVALTLPIPPTIPLSNMLPAYAIIVTAASLMEEDGRMIWVGYTVTFIMLVYLTVLISLEGHALVAFWLKLWHRFF
jgi:hypothetical protein